MNPAPLRRLTQSAMLVLVLVAPALGIWGVGATTRYTQQDMDYRYSAAGRAVSHSLDGLLGDASHEAASAVVGGPVSLRLFGVELLDPLMLPALLVDGQLPAVSAVIGVLAVLALHVLLGRAFCGYLCPYGTLSRGVSRLRVPLKRAGLVLGWTPPRWLRWTLLGAVLLAPVAGMGLAPLVLPYVGVARLAHSVLFGGVTGAAGAVLALLLSDLLLWDHGVCRGICPSGALQGALGRYRVLHLVARKGVGCQRSCHSCAEVCWLGLDPRSGNPGPDCDSCGRCIPDCPTARLAVVVRPGTVTRPVAVAALLLLLPLVHGCGGGPPPAVISAQAPWATPFQPASELERKRVRFAEYDREVGVLGVGIAGEETGPQGLRLYMEQEPGEPWTGPLLVRLETASGAAELSFPGSNAPPSVPNPTLYEALIAVPVGTELVVVDGPHAGARVAVPVRLRRQRSGAWLLAPALVLLLWVAGLLAARRRR